MGIKAHKPVFTTDHVIVKLPKFNRKVLLRFYNVGGLCAYSHVLNYRFDFNENTYYYQLVADSTRWFKETDLIECVEPKLFEFPYS